MSAVGVGVEEVGDGHGEVLGRGHVQVFVRAMGVGVGADEAGDRWFVDNWDRMDEKEIERLFEEVFAIFRRMLESPRAR